VCVGCSAPLICGLAIDSDLRDALNANLKLCNIFAECNVSGSLALAQGRQTEQAFDSLNLAQGQTGTWNRACVSATLFGGANTSDPWCAGVSRGVMTAVCLHVTAAEPLCQPALLWRGLGA
jgi:hypothetical protein